MPGTKHIRSIFSVKGSVRRRTLKQNQIAEKTKIKVESALRLMKMDEAMPAKAKGSADSISIAVAVVYLAKWVVLRAFESFLRSHMSFPAISPVDMVLDATDKAIQAEKNVL